MPKILTKQQKKLKVVWNSIVGKKFKAELKKSGAKKAWKTSTGIAFKKKMKK